MMRLLSCPKSSLSLLAKSMPSKGELTKTTLPTDKTVSRKKENNAIILMFVICFRVPLYSKYHPQNYADTPKLLGFLLTFYRLCFLTFLWGLQCLAYNTSQFLRSLGIWVDAIGKHHILIYI